LLVHGGDGNPATEFSAEELHAPVMGELTGGGKDTNLEIGHAAIASVGIVELICLVEAGVFVKQGAGRAVASMAQGESVVAEGVEQFNLVSEALEAITKRIQAAEQGISMIATATTEQSAATTGLTDNIHEISAEVKRTASQVDQTVSACAELARLAAGMEDLVKTFRLPTALHTELKNSTLPFRSRAA